MLKLHSANGLSEWLYSSLEKRLLTLRGGLFCDSESLIWASRLKQLCIVRENVWSMISILSTASALILRRLFLFFLWESPVLILRWKWVVQIHSIYVGRVFATQGMIVYLRVIAWGAFVGVESEAIALCSEALNVQTIRTFGLVTQPGTRVGVLTMALIP